MNNEDFWNNWDSSRWDNKGIVRKKCKPRGKAFQRKDVVKDNRVTFRMNLKEQMMLDDLCRRTGKNASEVVREALHSLDIDLRRFENFGE